MFFWVFFKCIAIVCIIHVCSVQVDDIVTRKIDSVETKVRHVRLGDPSGEMELTLWRDKAEADIDEHACYFF